MKHVEMRSSQYIFINVRENCSTFDASCVLTLISRSAGTSRTGSIARFRRLSSCFPAVPVGFENSLADVAFHLGEIHLSVSKIGENHIKPTIYFL
jgi:hypothetical protein